MNIHVHANVMLFRYTLINYNFTPYFKPLSFLIDPASGGFFF